MLFQLEDDYSGWFMKCVVDLEVLASSFPSMARNNFCNNTPVFNRVYECNVLCVVDGTGNDGIGHVDLVVSTPGEIVYFNPSTNKVSKIVANLMVFPYDEAVWFRDFLVHQFYETLCPV